MSNNFKDDERWNPPQPEEVAFVVDKLGGINATARLLKKNRTTVFRWVNGDVRIDFANWTMLTNRQ